MISIAVIVVAIAFLKRPVSMAPPSVLNFIKFNEARLHAVLFKNMYSLHGLLACIMSVFGHVCPLLIMVSYCIAGSTQIHAGSEMSFIKSRALYVSAGLTETTNFVVQSLSCSTAFMNSSVTLTLWFAFWKLIELYASPLKLLS